MKAYSGSHTQGCHKCGGFPGSQKKPVNKLLQCLKCGFFTCNKHLKGGFSKTCPNCTAGGKDLRPVMNKQSHTKTKSGGMPGHVTAKSQIKGSGGASEEVSKLASSLKGVFGGGGGKATESKSSGATSSTAGEGKPSKPSDGDNVGKDAKDVRVQEALISSMKKEVDSLKQRMEEMHSLATVSEEEVQKLSNDQKKKEDTEESLPDISLDEMLSSTDDEEVATPLVSELNTNSFDGEVEDGIDLEALEQIDALLKQQEQGFSLTKRITADTYFRVDNDEGISICKEYFKTSKDCINIVSVDAASEKQLLKLQELTATTENVFAATAFSPKGIKDDEIPNINELEILFNKRKKFIAIGEVSLDLHFSPLTIEKQKKLFVSHAELAIKRDIPLFISSKKADKELYDLMNKIRSNNEKILAIVVPVVRTVEMFQMILDHGLYLLLRPEITHDNEDLYRECIKELPIDRLLLASGEEISSPKKHFGRWNSPAFISETIAYASDLLGLEKKEFLHQMALNFNKIFNSDPEAGDDEFDFTPTEAKKTLTITEAQLLENDIDADGDELFVKEILDDGLIGQIYFDRDSRLFIYTPKEGFIGSDKFIYVVTDGRGGFDTANVTINVSKEYVE